MHLDYEDFTPGCGARVRARARVASDASTLDLSGEWRFHLWSTAEPRVATWADDFDDSA